MSVWWTLLLMKFTMSARRGNWDVLVLFFLIDSHVLDIHAQPYQTI